ncbi:hypothetical protein P9139_16400 [Curtobacterium flaccumfaciens]|nr:hypothetical protein P9139_16400 [Curtobacterium flaccumfaciens]
MAEVAKKADAARDAKVAAERFTGAALDLREANYTIRGKDSDVDAPPAISAEQVCVALPQQTDSWPRTVFAVVAEDCDAKSAPQALTLVQDSARDDYKVAYDVSLEAAAKIRAWRPPRSVRPCSRRTRSCSRSHRTRSAASTATSCRRTRTARTRRTSRRTATDSGPRSARRTRTRSPRRCPTPRRSSTRPRSRTTAPWRSPPTARGTRLR